MNKNIKKENILKIAEIYSKDILWKVLSKRHLQRISQTDAKKYKIIHVNPFRLRDNTLLPNKYRSNFGAVIGGFWDVKRPQNPDSHLSLLEDACYNRFVNEMDWKETRYYQYKAKNGCKKEAENACSHMDMLKESINTEGYKTQRELLSEFPEETESMSDDETPATHNEIRISIGRDGTMFQDGAGQHRLAVARTLQLNKVPVQVAVRHKKWQSIRDKFLEAETLIHLNDCVQDHSDHPDLKDLIN